MLMKIDILILALKSMIIGEYMKEKRMIIVHLLVL